MRHSFKEIAEALFTFALLIAACIGLWWLVGWSERVFGPENSGLFPFRKGW